MFPSVEISLGRLLPGEGTEAVPGVGGEDGWVYVASICTENVGQGVDAVKLPDSVEAFQGHTFVAIVHEQLYKRFVAVTCWAKKVCRVEFDFDLV